MAMANDRIAEHKLIVSTLRQENSLRQVSLLMLLSFIGLWSYPSHLAGQNGLKGSSSGGVMINADGHVKIRASAPSTSLRGGEAWGRISLRAVERFAQGVDRRADRRDVAQVAGIDNLARIERLEVIPNRDIVLLGPRSPNRGIDLEQLVTLWQLSREQQGPLSVSIDPEPQRLRRVELLLRRQETFEASLPQTLQRTLGPQRVSFEGLSGRDSLSHQVLAADLRMKQLLCGSGHRQLNELLGRPGELAVPRLWLQIGSHITADSEHSRLWRIIGHRTQVCVAENDGVANRSAMAWAQSLNQYYPHLRAQYAELDTIERVIEFSLVFAVIQRYDLMSRASLHTTQIDRRPSQLLALPRTTETHLRLSRRGRKMTILCGGVQLDPWKRIRITDELDASIDDQDLAYWGIPLGAQPSVFLIDCSESMLRRRQGRSFLDFAKTELIRILDTLPPEREFTVVAFSDEAQVWKRMPVRATPNNVAAAKRWLSQLPVGRGTSTYDAILRAMQNHRQACELFLLSDGWPTTGKVVRPEKILLAVSRLNASRRVVIHTIGVGCGAAQREFLTKLSDQNAGMFRQTIRDH